jgi:ABC-type nitrate/sulfonate/bicarbonate transport system permease component
MNALRRVAPPVALVVVLVAAWEGVVRAFAIAPYKLPAPARVGRALLDQRSTLFTDLRATLTSAVLGLLLGVAVGVVVAVPVATLPLLRRAVQPLLVASQSIPPFVYGPLLIVWFGYGRLPHVLVTTLVVFFPVVVSTVDGLVHVDRELVELLRGMGASRWQVVVKVMIPGALTPFVAGVKIGAAFAMFGAVFGEWIAATEGLGVYLNRAAHSFRNDRVFAATIVLATVSVALFGLVHLIGRTLTPWARATGEEASS